MNILDHQDAHCLRSRQTMQTQLLHDFSKSDNKSNHHHYSGWYGWYYTQVNHLGDFVSNFQEVGCFWKKSLTPSITDTSFYSTFRMRTMSNSCFFTPHRQFDILFKDVILFQVFCWSPEISSFRSWLLKTQLTWWCLRTQETVPDSCPPT